MGIKIVTRHGNTFKEKLYIPAIFGGMKTTLSHFITNLSDHPKIQTINYPEELPHEILGLAPLAVLILAMGVYPDLFLYKIEPTLQHYLIDILHVGVK